MSATPARDDGLSIDAARDAEFEAPAMRGLAGGPTGPLRLQHPPGLYLLYVTEMWERFSFYGMRAALTLYLTTMVAAGGLGWSIEFAGRVYGWYTGLVYLTPILGGYIADKFIGTHWSMIVGGLIIACGHFTLASMDLVPHGSSEHISMFFAGLLQIVIGTGFFKPCVSVMVGQLYPPRDLRRDAAFTIFYMGINLGAFLGPLICGGLRLAQRKGDVFGWSWAFGAAGVGMVLGLLAYLVGRPFLLRGVGLAPREKSNPRPLLVGLTVTVVAALGLATFGLYQFDRLTSAQDAWSWLMSTRPLAYAIGGLIAAGALTAILWFVFAQERADRGPVASIFIMSFFVIFFWAAFEQAGSSLTLFAEHRTDRSLGPGFAQTLYRVGTEPGYPAPWWAFAAVGAALAAGWIAYGRAGGRSAAGWSPVSLAVKVAGLAVGPALLVLSLLKGAGLLKPMFFPDDFLQRAEYPPDWFQSVNPLFILILAPMFASLWMRLGRAGREPSTPVKFGIGLILVGVGFVFMVLGARESTAPDGGVVRVTAFWLLAAYLVHTVGELCLSPVGLSMVNKLSPPRFVSLLMGVWFLANFCANLSGGYLAGTIERVERGELYRVLGGQADFFLLFVVAPALVGLVALALSPVLRRLMHGRA